MGKIKDETIQIRALERPEDIIIYQHWAQIHESLVTFQNKSTNKTFEYLFGEDGERLWKHFALDCKRQYVHFMTYLTQVQKNELIVNCHEDKELYL